MSIRELPDKWRDDAKEIIERPYISGFEIGVSNARRTDADELQAALPRWTRITEDPATWPENFTTVIFNRKGHFGFGEVFIREDGCFWTFNGTSAHDSVFPERRPTYWRPLCDLDFPPEES